MRTNITHVFLAILCSPFFGFSQNTSISGQINSYATVTSIDYCRNALIVSDVTGFQVEGSAILIQMQGAIINTEDGSENFGTITAINGAGLYEKCVIRAIVEDSIFLNNSLLNTYTLADKVQLVNMPTYQDATVTDTLTAKNWDGESGGVLAFKVEGTLTLNAPIDASGSGFRGGVTRSPENNCTGGVNNASRFAYEIGDWRGAAKGEGISQTVSGKEGGKGAQANGGGGGNDHNSGGGGGSHASLGGNGGKRRTPFIDPRLRCKGDNPGLKGKRLETLENRLFLGGGGGAGHTNNVENAGGGNGGGIVLIEVEILAGNEQVVASNGSSASEVKGDGASGGGAGGSIVLLVENVASAINIEAKGGNGGTVNNNNSSDCMGPGGGGSGGRFLTNADAGQGVNFNLAGGMLGLSINSMDNNCQNTSNDAENGMEGIVDFAMSLLESEDMVSLPEIISQPESITSCTGLSIDLPIETSGSGLTFQWQIDRNNGNGFENLSGGVNFSGVNTATLTITDVSLNLNGTQFRLIVASECLGETISDPIPLMLGSEAVVVDFEYELQENGVVIFTNNSEFANEILWDFGDGVLSSMSNTSFTFPEEGEYEVTLTATNDCGSESITKTVVVVFQPTSAFTANPLGGCSPLEITFENLSSENTASFEWSFPGGNPAISTDPNPIVMYNEGGTYEVTLIASNDLGSDTLTRRGFVLVQAKPQADFIEESQNDDLSIELTNTTTNGESFVWDFGDGSATSTQINPTHTYDGLGVYTVTLTATNDCGTSMITREIAVGNAPLAVFSANNTGGCFPVTIQFTDQSQGQVSEWNWTFPGGSPATSTEENPSITYTAPGSYGVSLTVSNELGVDDIQKDSFIQVSAAPKPNFNSESMDGEVNFINLSENAETYIWSFGDSNSSTEENPMHTYNRTGLYYVTLNAYNEFCAASTTNPVNIVISSIDGVDGKIVAKAYPNPVSDVLNIALEGLSPSILQLRLMDVNGRVLQKQQINSAEIFGLQMADYPAGLYYIQILSEKWQVTQRVIKE